MLKRVEDKMCAHFYPRCLGEQAAQASWLGTFKDSETEKLVDLYFLPCYAEYPCIWRVDAISEGIYTLIYTDPGETLHALRALADVEYYVTKLKSTPRDSNFLESLQDSVRSFANCVDTWNAQLRKK